MLVFFLHKCSLSAVQSQTESPPISIAAMRLWVAVLVSVVLLLLLLLGIFLLVPFPLAIFPSIVKSQVYIQRDKHGNLPKATSYWANLPATQWYDFYFFNITNPDEVLYNGAKPFLVEVGPYSYAETEFKQKLDWTDGDQKIFYENNKTWVYTPRTSCANCNENDYVMLPNPAYMSGLFLQKTQNFPPTALVPIMDILLLLLGEQPISAVKVGKVLFQGYDDPLVDFIHSDFVAYIINLYEALTDKPVYMPELPLVMGYFPNYNQSNDGNYTTLTGKGNTNNLGLIQTWCDQEKLDWWGDDYSADISNSGDGSFQKPQLKKTDQLKQFQSFTCRSFHLSYDSDSVVNGIQAYRFKINNDDYDTTIDKNKGYRYENTELVNYFPLWPCGSNHTYDPTQPGCDQISCDERAFLCNSCCDGSYVHAGPNQNATVLLPPGIVPLRCLPGQLVPLPFAGFLSPPHFAWSPEEVTSTMYGLAPDPDGLHHPGAFDIQPITGSTVGGTFKMQLAIPIYNEPHYTSLSNTLNNFLPSFWINVHVDMNKDARDYIHLTTRILPQIVLGVGIGSTVLACMGALLLLFFIIRARRASLRPRPIANGFPRGKDAWSTSVSTVIDAS